MTKRYQNAVSSKPIDFFGVLVAQDNSSVTSYELANGHCKFTYQRTLPERVEMFHAANYQPGDVLLTHRDVAFISLPMLWGATQELDYAASEPNILIERNGGVIDIAHFAGPQAALASFELSQVVSVRVSVRKVRNFFKRVARVNKNFLDAAASALRVTDSEIEQFMEHAG